MMDYGETKLLDAALAYAELGYRVFPCASAPNPAPLTQHGFHDASTDRDQIEAWWRRFPNACIGLATSGLMVIDIDGRQNPWLADEPELATELMTVPMSMTPGGGRHHIFRRPDDRNWTCTAGRLAEHVDTRTDGGYIIVPPSVRPDGCYRWINGSELSCPPDQLPKPPGWLIQRLDHLANGRPHEANGSPGLAASSNQIPDGQRNATLARLGGTMRRVGMSQSEIAAALTQTNQERCRPPLPANEVARIAASVARYEPDQIAVAVAEDHFGQMVVAKKPEMELTAVKSVGQLLANYPELRQPVIHGLLRVGESMNIIAPSKLGKSWLITDLALTVATGRPWLETFETEAGRVLVLDNELHAETTANRIPKVAGARQIPLAAIAEMVFVDNLRGRLTDIFSLGPYFRSLQPGYFKIIVLDAFYRFLPKDTDENSNANLTDVYNQLDAYASMLGCSFVLVHHASKGNQSGKSITDVGAGAGSQARATDTHLILRPHEQDDVVVLDAAVRSWPPIVSRCLRWTFPVWTPDDTLDPSALRPERPRRKKAEPKSVAVAEPVWDVRRFVKSFVGEAPATILTLTQAAIDAGLSERKATKLLKQAESQGLIHRWRFGATQPVQLATIPQPELFE